MSQKTTTPTFNALSITREDFLEAWLSLLEYKVDKRTTCYKKYSMDAKPQALDFEILWLELQLKGKRDEP